MAFICKPRASWHQHTTFMHQLHCNVQIYCTVHKLMIPIQILWCLTSKGSTYTLWLVAGAAQHHLSEWCQAGTLITQSFTYRLKIQEIAEQILPTQTKGILHLFLVTWTPWIPNDCILRVPGSQNQQIDARFICKSDYDCRWTVPLSRDEVAEGCLTRSLQNAKHHHGIPQELTKGRREDMLQFARSDQQAASSTWKLH